MLDRLLHHAVRENYLSEPGFARKKVSWVVVVSAYGHISGVIPLGDGKSGQSFDFCPHLGQNLMIAGGETRSQFLIDSLQTVALYWKNDTKPEEQARFRAKHEYYIGLLQKAEGASYLATAAKALSGEQEKLRGLFERQTPKPKPTDSATVLIGDINPLERNDWHDWWRSRYRSLQLSTVRKESAPVSQKMRCLTTGASIIPVATHPKVSGLAGIGGLGTGDVIAGFDKEAFQSFGLDQSSNAATDEVTATVYAQTLSRLIAENGVRLGSAMAVYWFDKRMPADDDPFAFLRDPNEPEAIEPGAAHQPRKLLTAIREGRRPDLLDNQYCALTVSGASGRVMVRDWMEGRFEELVGRVALWFEHLDIAARDGTRLARAPKFLAVAGCLERDLSDVSAPLMTSLWHAAISGAASIHPAGIEHQVHRVFACRIPYTAFTKALLRSKMDVLTGQTASHARMGILKAFHIRNKGDSSMKPYLNPDHPEPAYHCGRLLAILARLQRTALGDVGAGVVQRYYGAASQTPALALGRLIGNSKNHLNKLDGELMNWFEAQIAGVMTKMGDKIPRTLDLEKQSLFALGYYQQLATLNAGKQAAGQSENIA